MFLDQFIPTGDTYLLRLLGTLEAGSILKNLSLELRPTGVGRKGRRLGRSRSVTLDMTTTCIRASWLVALILRFLLPRSICGSTIIVVVVVGEVVVAEVLVGVTFSPISDDGIFCVP